MVITIVQLLLFHSELFLVSVWCAAALEMLVQLQSSKSSENRDNQGRIKHAHYEKLFCTALCSFQLILCEQDNRSVIAEGNGSMAKTGEDRGHSSSALAELTSHVCRRSLLLGMAMPLSSLGNNSSPAC